MIRRRGRNHPQRNDSVGEDPDRRTGIPSGEAATSVTPALRTASQRKGRLNYFLLLALVVLVVLLAQWRPTSTGPSARSAGSRNPNLSGQYPAGRAITPLPPPDLTKLSKQNRERFLAIQEAIRHAWGAYRYNVLLNGRPYGDDVNTHSGKGEFWLHHAATLYDSLDTLFLASLMDQYEEAVQAVLTSWPVAGMEGAWRPTKIFEYSIRVTAGLLGAYSVSADPRLLVAAQESADAVLAGAFRWSPTPLPRMYDVLAPTSLRLLSPLSCVHQIYSFFYRWGRDRFTEEHHINSLAGVGSFAVEYSFLTLATGQDRYRSASNAIFQWLVHKSPLRPDGMFPSVWNVMDGQPRNGGGTGFSSGADSFYEYLLKAPLLAGCERGAPECDDVAHQMLTVYRGIAEKSIPLHTATAGGKRYPTDESSYHHLLCFLPGLLALDGTLQDISLAKELVEGCHATYRQSQTGLGPETARIRRDSVTNVDARYQLRPEHVESLFVLYRKTGDPVYQEMAWEIFTALMAHCRTSRGFTSLSDVDDQAPAGQTGEMPSYFLAETLKYLLLVFGPEDYVDLKDFVFTTEAHPLRKLASASVT